MLTISKLEMFKSKWGEARLPLSGAFIRWYCHNNGYSLILRQNTRYIGVNWPNHIFNEEKAEKGYNYVWCLLDARDEKIVTFYTKKENTKDCEKLTRRAADVVEVLLKEYYEKLCCEMLPLSIQY